MDAERVHGKTHRTRLKVFGCALLVVAAVQDLVPPGTGIARATAAPKISAVLARSHGRATLAVSVGSAGSPVSVARSDFRLSAAGDMFAAQRWDAQRSRIKIAPRRTHSFRLTFAAPVAAVKHATLLFRSVVVPISGAGALPRPPTPGRAAQAPTINTVPINGAKLRKKRGERGSFRQPSAGSLKDRLAGKASAARQWPRQVPGNAA